MRQARKLNKNKTVINSLKTNLGKNSATIKAKLFNRLCMSLYRKEIKNNVNGPFET